MKKIKDILKFFILTNLFLNNACLAIDTGGYSNIYTKPTGSSWLNTFGGKILGVIQVVGISIAVIMLTVIAIKYMMASVEEKAQLKEQLIPYLIGTILLFGGVGIMSLIANWANELK